MGLTGKLRLNTTMSESEIYDEIRSVFSAPVNNNPNFQCDILQSAGGGTKSLVIPAKSSTFSWTAKQVASSCRWIIYILAKDKLCVEESEDDEVYTVINIIYQCNSYY